MNKQEKAQREKLNACLHTLSAWCIKRQSPEFNIETTLTMLAHKARDIYNRVRDAGNCCQHCGSRKDAYFSRIEPMGDFCQDCGRQR